MEFSSYSKYIYDVLEKINPDEINKFISLVFETFVKGRSIYVIGNGGSAANSSHLAEDLTKATCFSLTQEKRIKAFSLTDNVPWITALSNDNGYGCIFEQQLRTIAYKNDLLIAISGSGNSRNIINAVEWANHNGLVTIGITGYDGGMLKKMNQHSVHVPLDDMGTIEGIHSLIFHYCILKLKEKMKVYFKLTPQNLNSKNKE